MGRESERGKKVRHFSITFGVPKQQLNHLPPADLKNIFLLASSEFCRNYTKKTDPILRLLVLDNRE